MSNHHSSAGRRPRLADRHLNYSDFWQTRASASGKMLSQFGRLFVTHYSIGYVKRMLLLLYIKLVLFCTWLFEGYSPYRRLMCP